MFDYKKKIQFILSFTRLVIFGKAKKLRRNFLVIREFLSSSAAAAGKYFNCYLCGPWQIVYRTIILPRLEKKQRRKSRWKRCLIILPAAMTS